MKKSKYLFVLLLLISITVVCSIGTFFYVKLNNKQVANDDEILVMTSCNPVYLATINILDGVDGYRVQNLSQPTTGCLHDYTLTTEDMKNLSKADVLVVNGGGMEGYLDDVIAAYPDLKIIDTYEDIEHSNGLVGMDEYLIKEDEEHDHEEESESLPLEGKVSAELTDEVSEHHHDHGANSHIWMDERLYQCQVISIANGLMDANPNREESAIAENVRKYTAALEKIDKQGLDVAVANENVAILHEAFAYTAQSLGANVVATMDLDEERQVSAGEVSAFIDEIKEHDVKLVLAEYDYGNAMGKLIEEQTDAKVVYLETLVHGDYSGLDYITVLNKNYANIKNVL
ncbi:metal ABC transporter substrate-binding protein [Pseudobutyrivibrio xylanivorans]|uniref:Zinc transport system substrate-binding protein n=1 Tax=Pseudobutyrivibrio xylanivorans TaxID=185007 RepID=A0A1G5RS94_PSEXY|nr:metal ABC transporter substrate-binding protein [Pseudobutyrivibrio xylanivorans]SCZ76963.1 zinc transport system substrate-binding protein [Pseudobutyrivibrio xylanivorans]